MPQVAARQAAKQRIADEKREWAENFGSRRLKLAFELNQECGRLFMEEYALYTDCLLDYDDAAVCSERVSPSEDALDALRRSRYLGEEAEIVWIKYFENPGGSRIFDTDALRVVKFGKPMFKLFGE